jgi:DNA-binding CsgD family transcriptional regulator
MGAAGAIPAALRDLLRAAEERGLRGEADAALVDLLAVQRTLTDDEQRLAVAEQAAVLTGWGGTPETAQQICDLALAAAGSAQVRGGVLLARGRATAGPERRRVYTQALTEFSVADDIRGKALALGHLAFPYEDDDEITHAYRERLGRDAFRLAVCAADPYAMAVCAGNLAACETFLGRPTALRRWRRAAEDLPADLDARAATAVTMNYLNWALTAAGLGDYGQAARVARQGSAVSRGTVADRTFAAIEAFVCWRRGELAEAAERAAEVVAAPGRPAYAVVRLVIAACDLERAPRPEPAQLDGAVRRLATVSEQLSATALGVQARVRAARREPQPARALVPALARARQRERRFGWEDLVVALAELDPEQAAGALAELGDLWPVGARARAARQYVDGLVAGPAGYPVLVAAGEAFLALPEPLTAGRALHAAAAVAPDVRAGNALRRQAIEVYRAAGADRSLAGVLRDRRLHRSAGSPRLPADQRYAVSAGLTPREHEIAVLAQRGLTAREIAAELSLSAGTVRNHLLHIRQKFGGIPKRRLAELLAPEV